MHELYFDRLYEIKTVRIEDREQIDWTVVAPNKRAAVSAFRFLLADNKDFKIVAVHRNDAAIISPETAARITHAAHSHAA